MRRSRDARSAAAVMGPDGRLAPFDRDRLAASLRRALSPAGRLRWSTLADDLAYVVGAYLRRADQGPLISCDELATLVGRVLVQAGHEGAARRHASRRQDPPLEPAPPPSVNRLVTASERNLAGTLVREHALRAVLPRDAVTAWARGRLRLDPWLSASRLPAAVLAADWVEAFGRGRRVDAARLGAALRGVAGLVVDEVVLPWSGALPTPARLVDLAHHLIDPLGRSARVVLSLSGARPDDLGPALEALARVPEAALDLCVESGSEGLLSELPPEHLTRLQVSRAAPRTGAVLAAAALDLAALARDVDSRDASAFLELVGDHVELARCSLSSWASSEPVATAREALAPAVGPGRHDRVRLVLDGVLEARRVLLGDGSLARANGDDLLAALGGRVRRLLAGQAVELRVAAGAEGLPRLAERLGLDADQPVAGHLSIPSLSPGGSGPCA